MDYSETLGSSARGNHETLKNAARRQIVIHYRKVMELNKDFPDRHLTNNKHVQGRALQLYREVFCDDVDRNQLMREGVVKHNYALLTGTYVKYTRSRGNVNRFWSCDHCRKRIWAALDTFATSARRAVGRSIEGDSREAEQQ